MKRLIFLLILALFLVACNGATEDGGAYATPTDIEIEEPEETEAYEDDTEDPQVDTEDENDYTNNGEPETETEDETAEPDEQEGDDPTDTTENGTEPAGETDATEVADPSDETPDQDEDTAPEEPAYTASPREPLRVIATIFPQYDFLRQIAGDRIDRSMLLPPGAESHGFEPTPRDMMTLGEADLLIHIGGDKDAWVGSNLAAVGRSDMRTIAMLDLVQGLIAEHVYYCDDDEDGCDIPHIHIGDHYDEHVWTCPRNAILIVGVITDVLSEMDPANASYFRANADRFIEELRELDRTFVSVVANGVRDIVIFGDRFPFVYFVNTYGLTALSAFTGCCTATQVSPATIAALITRVNNDNIPVVFHIELSNRMIAQTIAEETGARVLEFHSAHNVSRNEFNAGVTYMEIMRRNVEALRAALG